MFTLILALGCDLGGKTYVCDRAPGSPTDRGYINPADGCAATEVCVSEPGEGGGDCFSDVECTLDGLSAGIGMSKDCALNEVCHVPENAWHGTCEPWTTTSEEFSSATDCDVTESTALSIEQGEIIHFTATFEPPDHEGGANVFAGLKDSLGEVVFSGNPLGVGGYVLDTPQTFELTHSFQYTDDHTWEFSVFECGAVLFSALYERVSGPIPNTDQDHAMPLAKGDAATGIIGCYDQDGGGTSQHLVHVYAIELTAGEVITLGLEVEPQENGDFGWLTLGLEDAAGAVVVSGNPLAVDTSLEAGVALDYTVETSGFYYLKVDQDYSRCYNSEYTIHY